MSSERERGEHASESWGHRWISFLWRGRCYWQSCAARHGSSPAAGVVLTGAGAVLAVERRARSRARGTTRTGGACRARGVRRRARARRCTTCAGAYRGDARRCVARDRRGGLREPRRRGGTRVGGRGRRDRGHDERDARDRRCCGRAERGGRGRAGDRPSGRARPAGRARRRRGCGRRRTGADARGRARGSGSSGRGPSPRSRHPSPWRSARAARSCGSSRTSSTSARETSRRCTSPETASRSRCRTPSGPTRHARRPCPRATRSVRAGAGRRPCCAPRAQRARRRRRRSARRSRRSSSSANGDLGADVVAVGARNAAPEELRIDGASQLPARLAPPAREQHGRLGERERRGVGAGGRSPDKSHLLRADAVPPRWADRRASAPAAATVSPGAHPLDHRKPAPVHQGRAAARRARGARRAHLARHRPALRPRARGDLLRGARARRARRSGCRPARAATRR